MCPCGWGWGKVTVTVVVLKPRVVCRALADMNNDGRMDQVEFSIAMKLIKLKLQGYQLPAALPPIMKQQPGAISGAPAFGE